MSRSADGWRMWGPYLSERQWGTTREDYSAEGNPWRAFPFEDAAHRTYRWGEDGLLGWTDHQLRLCLAPALWNERDPILKERLFGLGTDQGNHGEDVKELYWYEDAVPSHAYNRASYAYPQAEFPYETLRRENAARTRAEEELEVTDTGAFSGNRYTDLVVEYAKAGAEDMLVRYTVTNRGPQAAPIQLIPQLWFRNTWSWGEGAKPELVGSITDDRVRIDVHHDQLGGYVLHAPRPDHLLFTDNEDARGAGSEPRASEPPRYRKDAFHRFVVAGERGAVNPLQRGSKAGLVYRRMLAAGESFSVSMRLTNQRVDDPLGPSFEHLLAASRAAADAFYAQAIPPECDDEERSIRRAAYAGLLWTKQAYHYDVGRWLEGDTTPPRRVEERNTRWRHLRVHEVVSVPDKWEFPWFAAWDLAFHCVPLARIDADFAKTQLEFLLDTCMHPSGQVAGFEADLDDVHPPVLGWAAWRVFCLEREHFGREDRAFLEGAYQRLRKNFDWWLTSPCAREGSTFGGSRFGLDNIGLFDRSAPPPTGGALEQADGTGWMARFSLDMMRIALELSKHAAGYEAEAIRYFGHFVRISRAAYTKPPGGGALFDDEDGFFYDRIRLPDGRVELLRLRSIAGLLPVAAVSILEAQDLARLPAFAAHVRGSGAALENETGRLLLAMVDPERLRRLLARVLDGRELLSPHGIRSLSKAHEPSPLVRTLGGERYVRGYEPAESRDDFIGGNSNWRGPVWLPLNYLLLEALRCYGRYLGDAYRVELPTGSAHRLELTAVAEHISERLGALVRRDPQSGRRPAYGPELQHDPRGSQRLLFHEYFHGDDGSGRGASHQTGWTALLAARDRGGSGCDHKPASVVPQAEQAPSRWSAERSVR